MPPSSSDVLQRVVKLVHELLLDEEERGAVTASTIAEKIDFMLLQKPAWAAVLDRQAAVDELIRRFSVWVGDDTALSNDLDHVPWLSASRKKDWRYWQRYREWLERKLPNQVVSKLDQSTDSILQHLEDPLREGAWDRRGLVVGHVQSGKTANYTGLICKAADAGYKIIVVLAGLHNNLRSQTQIRLEEGFLGYETSGTNHDARKPIGVGEFDRDLQIRPNCATNRSNNGDFNTKIGRHLAISPEERPWLFVVKKNKAVLMQLLDWVQNRVADVKLDLPDPPARLKGDPCYVRRRVTKLPLLIIDDEADNASVDTGEEVVKDDGTPDEDHQPKAINLLIRRIMHSFSRSAYIGYTATPFANIFIHERGETKEEGADLFPSAFIVNLGAASNYIGSTSFFKQKQLEDAERLGLVRQITMPDEDGSLGSWLPTGHKNGFVPRYGSGTDLPPMLVQAIDAFLLAGAARSLRGQAKEHSSMLIHATRFTSVQKVIFEQVDLHVSGMRQRLVRRIDDADILHRLKSLWLNDFQPTSQHVSADFPEMSELHEHSWEQIYTELCNTVSDIQVKMINGTAKDALDYANRQDVGLKVIAIGGDKLSRGLTLEGLTTSYFLRASKMYDTLMQMGRWFGYRPGYLDLTRLYTTTELSEWFEHIADAAEELREEFDVMAASGATPREYGLKVKSHGTLMVTSRLKMRSAKTLYLSFSGQLLETVALYRDAGKLRANLEAVQTFLGSLGPSTTPDGAIVRQRPGKGLQKWQGYLWNDVPAARVVEFLKAYRTHPDAYKVNSDMIVEFIGSMEAESELTNWTVAVVGADGGEGETREVIAGLSVNMIVRTERSDGNASDNRFSIGRLMSPRDEAIDLDEAAWKAALDKTQKDWHADPARRKSKELPDNPNGPSIRFIKGSGAPSVAPRPDRGLLILYLIDPVRAGLQKQDPPIAAFGISFPGSKSGVKVEYKANHVLWVQDYGASE